MAEWQNGNMAEWQNGKIKIRVLLVIAMLCYSKHSANRQNTAGCKEILKLPLGSLDWQQDPLPARWHAYS